MIFIPTLTAGGAERVAAILANEWSRYPETLVTVVTLFQDDIFFPLDRKVELICLGLTPNTPHLFGLVQIFRSLIVFRRVARASRSAFVLSFMNKYNVYCLLALLGTGMPVIASERGSPNEVLPWVRVMLRNATYPLASAVIVQTKQSQRFISRQVRLQRIVVIPNPISLLVDQSERRPEKMVLAVGRLHWMKGHNHLLEAFAAMTTRDWTLVVCGDGELRDALEAQAGKLGIIDRTQFQGTVRDLAPYFVRAGIFAFSSLSEGFPNALAEAMVAGIPCVSYDCETGPSELIADGDNGLLVPVGNTAAFATALDRLATDPKFAEALGVRAAQIANRVEIGAVSNAYWKVCTNAAGLRWD